MIKYKNIIVGVTGGIAAYKTCELVHLLTKQNVNVKVVMTDAAEKFIHPNTFAALTNNKVHNSLFEDPMLHIELAKWADCIVIAPATAATISNIAMGAADNLLTTIILASEAPCFIAPAMNKVMWQKQVVQKNIKALESYDFNVIPPEHGIQACGDVGYGRMAEPETILARLNTTNKLTNLRILITAGATQEKIDPVRYLSNFSSGKMGYALACYCANNGAEVTLISGPTKLNPPAKCTLISVISATDMCNAVNANLNNTDIIISAAAVADYTIKNYSQHKIKKHSAELCLELKKTVDILASICNQTNIFKVGFCAETDNLRTNAQQKIINKKLNAIVANIVTADGYPFGSDTNQVTYINKNQEITELAPANKNLLAEEIMACILKDYAEFK